MKLSEYLKQNGMSSKEYFDMQKRRSNGKITLKDYRKNQEISLKNKVGFDTFESDLKSLGTTVESIYNGWQDQDTMNNTKASIVSMQERLNAYQEYVKLFGGEDVTELANGYKAILEDWDNRASVYGQYKNADAYNVANKNVQLEKQFSHEDGSGYTFEEVQAELKKYAPDSDEYKYLSTYTNYSDLNDFNKAMGSDGVVSIQNEIAALKAEKEKLDSDYKANGGWVPSPSHYNRPSQNQVKSYHEWHAKSLELENKIKELEDAGYYGELKIKKNLRELEHKVDLYKPEYEGRADFEEKSKYVTTYNNDKSQYGDLTYEYINNVDGAREEIQMADEMENRNGNGYMSQWQKAGYDLLREDEIAIYNYKYKEEGKDSANKFLEDMQTVLDKRRTDKLSASWEQNAEKLPILSNVATVIMKPAGTLVGAIDDAVNLLQGKEYNPYSYAHTTANYVSDTRKYTSEDIEENTNFELFGQNVLSFLYNTGMSLADSAYGVATVGKFNSAIMGTSAFQDKAKELVASGADQDVVWESALTSGVAEALFEHIGIDNLFKIKNIDSLSSFVKNALKQAGAEGAEEIGTEITNIIADDVIRGKDSELYKMYNDLIERGYSEKEALSKTALQAGSQVAWAGIGGALSGMAMGSVSGGKNYSKNKTIGKEIRGNERVTDMLNIASLSPQESDAYAAYTEYAKQGVNAENITDAQLGNLYGMVDADARGVLASKKSTLEQRQQATETEKKLSAVHEKGALDKDTIGRIERRNTYEEGLHESAELLIQEGLESAENTDSFKLATRFKERVDNGEKLSTQDILKLQNANTKAIRQEELANRVKNMPKAEADLFLKMYDGKSDVDEFGDSFNLVLGLAKDKFPADYILERRGVLSPKQVNAIQKEVVLNPMMAKQKKLNEIVKEQGGKNLEIQGTIDDSAIDYDNTGADGKVNWSDIHPNTRATIALISGFSVKAAGMDVKLVTNGRDYGFTGQYDRQGNTVYIDINAIDTKMRGADSKGRHDNSRVIINAAAHEFTHWMEDKAPELYAEYSKMVLDTLTSGSKTLDDLIAVRKGYLDAAEERREAKAKKEGKEYTKHEYTPGEIKREIVARASEDMLALSEEGKRIFESLSESDKKQFANKIQQIFHNIMDWINNVLPTLKSSSPEAKLLRELAEDITVISKKWDEMLRQAAKANAAMKKAGVNDEAIMESKTGDTQNADIDTSIDKKYWRTGFSKTQFNELVGIVKFELGKSTGYIDNDTKWLYNNKSGRTYFALYSTIDVDNPTILYASKGKTAQNENQWFGDFIAEVEKERNNGGNDLREEIINEVLTSFGYALGQSGVYSRGNAKQRGNNGNVRLYSQSSGIRPSAALLNCLRNIAKIQERESGVTQYSDIDTEYIDVIESGNMEKVQKMVDKADVDAQNADIDTDIADQYNNWESYELTDEFVTKVPYDERHDFLRSLANQTNGLKQGERKNIAINTGKHVYLYAATGYMNGSVEDVFKVGGKKVNAEIKAWRDINGSGDTGATTFDSMAQSYGSLRGRNDWDNAANGYTEKAGRLDDVDEQARGGDPVGYLGESDGDFSEGEELIPGSLVYTDDGRVVKVNEDGTTEDIQYSDIDAYTEEMYNAFGWATYNGVINAKERETLLSRYADFKHNRHKYPVTRWGEAVIHSTETPNVIMYVRTSSTIDVPEITRIVRIKADDSVDISRIRERIVANEFEQKLSPYETINSYYGEEYLESHRKRDYATFREYQNSRGKGVGGQTINPVSEELQNGERGNRGSQESGRTDSEIINTKTYYADIDAEVDIYEVLGENERLNKENKTIREDVERLKERLKLERQLTHGNHFNENQLDAVAGHIRNLGDSNYSKPKLINKLREVYNYIATSKDVTWDDLFARLYGIAEDVLGEARPVYSPNDYYANIYKDLRNTEISLSEEQKQYVKSMLGVDSHKAFFGKIKVSDKGIPLNAKWEEWAGKYPNEFAETNDKDQVLALLDIYETAKELKEVVEEYDVVERTRWLANEIYNQYWNVSPIRTTADKYDKQIKRLNYEHRNAMKELRDSYKERLEKQKKADRAERSRIFKKLREDHIKELKEIRQSGKERLDKYKEEAARKTRIQSITAQALTLNEWLVKNSKDKHIHESMKGPVVSLLQAIDFSSKRALGMWGGDMSGVPTNKDISLQKALSQVQQMMADASVGKEDLILLYGHELDADIKAMVESVDEIMRNVGDNEFILNKMTLNDLITLDNVVKTIKHAVTQMNKFHTVHHAKGIANLAQEEIVYAEKLGKAKIYTDKSLKAGVKKLLAWKNINPYYAFKRFGTAGKKIFEAFQDGYDKFAFNIKEIIDFTNSTYKAKEVQEWEKEIKTFKLRMPATEEQLSRADYEPEYQDVQMTVAQIMDLYLLNKREAARVHLLGGGIRVADIETKGSEIIAQAEGAVLEQQEIDAIIKTLTLRQIEVADALSRFMNTTTTDWGNEVSMARFGYKAFGKKNYVPMQVDKNNLAVDDETEKNNSLFRLLNMSFTKGLTEGANNRLVISSIFDVFAQHTSDMAKYNALALPVLDAFRWYNYKEKGFKGETAFVTKSVKQAIENAFGKDGQSYITTFLKDLNGQENTSRDTVGRGFFTKAKIAAVGANIRVALLQPTAYLKASANINNKYLIKALLHKPKIGRAEQYCGMALWKSLGYFDTNVQRGVADQIKHAETKYDKAVELSMKGAEWGDKITFGYLWNAAELEIREKHQDLKVGSDEFYTEVGKRLRDIIYSTQVVDSVMTRSEMMRSPDWGDKLLTTFASEPTLAYNMLADAYFQTQLDARELGSKKAAIKKNAKHMARVFTAYTVTNLVAALVESGFDVLRDDDDEEMDVAEFIKLYFENFATNQSITVKIPWLKEAVSILQGFTSTRMDTQWIQTFSNTLKQVAKLMQGEGSPTKLIKNGLQTISYAFGLPFYNAYRDFMATLNKLDILTAEELEEILSDFN